MGDVTCSVEDCSTTKIMARGWCGPHYKRWWRYGDPLAAIQRRAPDGATLAERLAYVGWDEVVRRPDLGPCHEWKGLRDPKGYPRVFDGDRATFAHRVSLAVKIGLDAVPRGQFHACHRCDNPPCMRAAHLFVGDDSTNMADAVAKHRTANGERRPQHKLTDAQVAEIRATFTGWWGQQAALGRQFGVSPSYISMLVRDLARTEETHWEAVGGRPSLPRGGEALRVPPDAATAC